MWLLLVTQACAVDAPFLWTLRVDGAPVEARSGPVPVDVPGWSCELTVQPGRTALDGVVQAATLRCDGPKGVRAETLVMCMTDADRATDTGSGNLLLDRGADAVSLELGCASPGVTPRARLQLDPAAGAGAALGVPATRTPRTPGTWRWKVGTNSLLSVDAPGPVPVDAPGWSCEQEVSGVEDPAYGYSEYGTLSCRAGDTRAMIVVPCARPPGQAHACQAGNLAVGGAKGRSAVLMVCADVGNPECD